MTLTLLIAFILAAGCFFFAAVRVMLLQRRLASHRSHLIRVSQRLKGHLTAIKWFTDLLLEQGSQLKISQMEYLRKIKEANDLSVTLLHEVLDSDEMTYSRLHQADGALQRPSRAPAPKL